MERITQQEAWRLADPMMVHRIEIEHGDHDGERIPTDYDGYLEARALLEQNGD